MLFLARMDVRFPPHLDPQEVERLQRLEKEYSRTTQQNGHLTAIWRIVGEYANYSVFDVESNEELHRILSGFPMYSHMRIKITPLSTHPNWVGRE